MSFLYPAFLAGALAVAIPVLLHLLRRDVAPEVPFSSVRLLRRSPIERSRRRRLRDLVLLAARVAALLLLATAFARPYVSASAEPDPLLIVAVDRSFSMGAPGRFERARDLAREAIDQSGLNGLVAVIAFDERAQVVSAPGSAADARAALSTIQPGSGATRYGPAVDKALEMAAGGHARLVFVSDLQRTGWEDEQAAIVPQSLEVQVRDAGEPPANAGLTQIRVGPDRITVSVRNTGTSPLTGRVRALVDGKEVASAPLNVVAASIAEVVIPHRVQPRGRLTVALDDPAGFPADNVRHAVLDPLPRPPVLTVGADAAQSGFYLARALDAAEGDAAFDVRTVSAASFSQLSPADLSKHVAVVLLTTRGLDRRGRESLAGYVRGGGGLLIAAAPEVDPAVLASTMNWPQLSAVVQDAAPVRLSATDLRHPIFRPFGALAANLGQVRFNRSWRLRADGWDVAARFTDGSAAVVERREGAGRVVLFASDLDRRWNDFPLHASFVPFALETVRYVAGSPDRRREYLVAEAPAGAKAEPGIYQAASDGRLVAVNVDPRESASDRLGAEEFSAMVQQVATPQQAPRDAQAQQTEERQHLWRYGLVLMLMVLVAESFVGKA
jgi:hypothetical protein